MDRTLPQIDTKAIAFGEIHGIRNLIHIKVSFIDSLLKSGCKVFVGLERDFDQSENINAWMKTGETPSELLKRFVHPTTSSFLCDQFDFLNDLSHLYRAYPNQMKIHCLDISFSTESETDRSREIRNITDEDVFDLERENFIIDQFSQLKGELDSSDKVVWIAGNMHCSKTDSYFPIQGKPEPHIKSVGSWLNSEYGCTSIFSLPFGGKYTYQFQEKLVSKNIQSPQWTDRLHSFEGLKKSLSITSHFEFSEAYDWIIGIKECEPSKMVSNSAFH